MPEPTRIKICGITNEADALESARLRADFIGFIFYPPSPRYVVPKRAAEVLRAMREAYGANAPKAIGVFVDEAPKTINDILQKVQLDGIQFAGDEPPESLAAIDSMRIRGLSLETLDRLGRYDVDAYLCDTHAPEEKGGTGVAYDYDLLRPHLKKHRIIIAGGLTPETVGAVVSRLRPWGVDVSSALESAPGKKDHARIQTFMKAVRESSP